MLGGLMSIGMVTAYIAYYSMFTQRASALVDQMVQLKLLSVPLMRISDIAHATSERSGTDGGRGGSVNGAIELQKVAFRYGQGEAPVLKGASLRIEPGEFVAITGPSGIGKTTLLRLMTGVETPNFGSVLYDGRPLSHWSLHTLRSQLGVVMQEDSLMRGSLAENIALYADEIDMERVRTVAKLCNIAEDIEAMPMGYESLVGDMGSALSGGQKQRILLARALYRNPKILLLDEATSHLDRKNEVMVQKTLCELGITRVVVAHRKETIAAADRVLRVENGIVKKITRSEAGLKAGTADTDTVSK